MSGFLIRSFKSRTRSACGAKNYITAHTHFSIRKMNKDNKISNARFVQPADLRAPTTVVKIMRVAKQKAETSPLFIYVKNFLFFFEKKY